MSRQTLTTPTLTATATAAPTIPQKNHGTGRSGLLRVAGEEPFGVSRVTTRLGLGGGQHWASTGNTSNGMNVTANATTHRNWRTLLMVEQVYVTFFLVPEVY